MGVILYRRRPFFSARESPRNTPPILPCCPKRLLARPAVGRDANRLLPKPPLAFWTPNWHHGRGSDVVVGCKSLKCFGGPGEIRTHDLFHAMEARSIAYRQVSSSFMHLQTSIFGPRLDRVTSSTIFRTLPGPRDGATSGPRWPRTCFFARTR